MKKNALFLLMIFASSFAFAQNKGYEKAIEANGGIGLDNCQKYTFGVSMINGYRFNDNLFLGAGVGYEYLNGLYYHSYEYQGKILGSSNYDSFDVRNLVQAFARLKFNLTGNSISPFFSADLGTTIGLSSNEIQMANGLFYEIGVGCDFKINDVQTFYILFGYNAQNYEYKYYDTTFGSSGVDLEKQMSGKFCVHFGLKF